MSFSTDYEVRSGPSRCRFSYERREQVVLLVDLSGATAARGLSTYRSLTNGMDEVAAYLAEKDLIQGGDSLLYRDATGQWDQVLLSARLAVEGFRYLRCRDPESAVALVSLERRRVT